MKRAKLITALEALLRFELAHKVREGKPLASITLSILHDREAFAAWEAALVDAGFSSAA